MKPNSRNGPVFKPAADGLLTSKAQAIELSTNPERLKAIKQKPERNRLITTGSLRMSLSVRWFGVLLGLLVALGVGLRFQQAGRS